VGKSSLGKSPLWGKVLFGEKSSLGKSPLWGKVLFGEKSSLGKSPLWGKVIFGEKSSLGKSHLWVFIEHLGQLYSRTSQKRFMLAPGEAAPYIGDILLATGQVGVVHLSLMAVGKVGVVRMPLVAVGVVFQ
jgi:hypothetical protein